MTVPGVLYVFKASLVKVVDGDTVDLDIDTGLHCHRLERIRLLGVNCPEVTGITRDAGLAAKEYVKQWFQSLTSSGYEPVVIETYKSDVFGRYLGDIWRVVDGAHLNQDLLDSGHAVVFK
jgi:micrococcal nuclease